MTYQAVNGNQLPLVQYATPAAAATVTVNSSGYVRLLLNPSGTLATLTVALPGSPGNGDVVEIGCSQAVTILTLSGGTIIGGISSFAIGGFATYCYSSTASKWFRIG